MTTVIERANRRVLVADAVAEEGLARLREGAEVEVRTGLAEPELCEIIGGYDAIVVRSQTQVTERVIAAGRRLRVIARAGVGVDNIDVPAATRHGVLVVNSGEGNTIAAAEHTVALLLALSRKIPQAAASLARGEWKRGKFVGVEVLNKTLGVLGLGRIGREVARRARGLGMQTIASDQFISPELAAREGVELVELEELLRRSDFLTVHTPLTRETRGMIGDAQLAMMKPGARLLNCARGGIVDEEALARALESGHLGGAALDVFAQEPPPPDHPLLRNERVVATPHLGASTEEAQVNVALDVAEQILAVMDGRPARNAVNVPAISAEAYARLEPYLRLGRRIGKLLAQLADGPPRAVAIAYSGELLALDAQPVTRAVLVGLLQPALEQPVNEVNAPLIAESRGIRLTESKTLGEHDSLTAMRVEVTGDEGSHAIAGTALSRSELRIREIDQFQIDLAPEGYMLLSRHHDRPGVIGAVGTILGQHEINIAGMHVGREGAGKRALMALTVDDPVPAPLLEEIREAMGAEFLRFVEL